MLPPKLSKWHLIRHYQKEVGRGLAPAETNGIKCTLIGKIAEKLLLKLKLKITRRVHRLPIGERLLRREQAPALRPWILFVRIDR